MPADVKILAAAKNVLAQIAFGVGVGNGLAHDVDQVPVFAANINKADFRADSQAGNNHAFNHRVRIVLQDRTVFAGTGLAFIAIDQDVFGFGSVFGDEAPLHARWESRHRRVRAGWRS